MRLGGGVEGRRDTNVVISGLVFGGWPYRVLEGWRDGRLEIVVSGAILEEYWAVAGRLSEEFPGVNAGPFLEMLSGFADLVEAPDLSARVCPDPGDDKFLACALASGAKVVVSGNRGLQGVSGYRGIKVVSPRRFVEEWLRAEYCDRSGSEMRAPSLPAVSLALQRLRRSARATAWRGSCADVRAHGS